MKYIMREFIRLQTNLDNVVPVLVLVVVGVILQSCSAQHLEIDVSPNIARLYERLNRGAYNMLHWNAMSLRRRDRQHRIPSQSPQVVLFGKNQSGSKVVRSEGDVSSSPSHTQSHYVLPHSISSGGEDSGEIYSTLSRWDGRTRNPASIVTSYGKGDDDFHTSGSGSGYYPSTISSEWVSGPPPGYSSGGSGTLRKPRPPPRKYTYHHGPPPPPPSGPKIYSHPPPPHHTLSSLSKYHGPLKSFYESAPPLKTYKSYGPPGTTTTSIHHSSFPSSNGWDAPSPPVAITHSSSPGWSSSEPESPPSPGSGWGWEPPSQGGDGWGWAPQCDPNAVFELNSYDDIPPGSTFVDGYNRSATRDDLPPTLVPTPPVIFTVGAASTLPPNYSTQFSEVYNIRVNPDGTTNIEKEVNHRPHEGTGGDGSGNRGGASNGGGRKNRNQQSTPNALRMTSSVIASPYISAPINGSNNNNGFFSTGLQNRAAMFREGPPHPLTTQVDALLQLFNEVDTLQRRQAEIDAEEEKKWKAKGGWGWSDDEGYDGSGGGYNSNRRSGGGGGGRNGAGAGSNGNNNNNNNNGGDSDIASPTVVLMVQRFSVPEPNTSEAGMLDSAFNFGPQANRFTFGDLNLITEGYKDIGGADPIPLSLGGMGNSVSEVQDSLSERIRAYLKALREASAAAYEPVEEMAYNGFEQHQYFIVPPPELCLQAIDPPKFRGTISVNCGYGPINANQDAPGCFPPRC